MRDPQAFPRLSPPYRPKLRLWGLLPVLVLATGTAWPHGSVQHGAPASARGLKAPAVPGLNRIVKNKKAAIALGKALFWDVNVGSDGVACASCHFHAGADIRVKNQLNNGEKRGDPSEYPDLPKGFKPTASGGDGGPNYTLTKDDFPFHRFENPLDIRSRRLYETDNVMSSAGSYGGRFIDGAPAGSAHDTCDRAPDGIHQVGGVGVRAVEPRNTPTTINAVFNFRNFWDGRASNVFNGSSPFGDRDPNAGIWVIRGGQPKKERLALPNASLASQAAGPPLSVTEMSCADRSFPAIGRKVLNRRALEGQRVHAEDSVLARLRDANGFGLSRPYRDLIKAAFRPQYWKAGAAAAFGGPTAAPYSQMEANFALFFGLAIQMYEATLISDQAPYDRIARNKSALAAYTRAFGEVAISRPELDFDAKLKATEDLLRTRSRAIPESDLKVLSGLQVFIDGHCDQCHTGPLFTKASVPEAANYGKPKKGKLVSTLVDREGLHSAGPSLVDTGFSNTGVTHESFDPGLGGNDDFGQPLSLAAQYVRKLKGEDYRDRAAVDAQVDVCAFLEPFSKDVSPSQQRPAPGASKACQGRPEAVVPKAEQVDAQAPLGVKGAFKIPTLRNVELTGPYMHHGGLATLEQVVDFYVRTGNYDNPHKTGVMPTLNEGEATLGAYGKEALIAFLKSLTDERVRYEKAPFDHPQLSIPNGHQGDHVTVRARPDAGFTGQAEDQFLELREVGRQGRPAEALEPLGSFEAVLEGGVNTVRDKWVNGGQTENSQLQTLPVLPLDGTAAIYTEIGKKSFYETLETLAWNDVASAETGNGVHRGWTHNSKWAGFKGTAGQKITLAMTDADNVPGVHPAFTVFLRPEGQPLGWPDTKCPPAANLTDCVPAHLFPQQADWVMYDLPENPAHAPSTSYRLRHVAAGWDGDPDNAGNSFNMHPTALNDLRVTDGQPGTLTVTFTLPETGYYLMVISNVEELNLATAAKLNIRVSLTAN
jgi:cytochrome c peroxidase